MGTARGWLQLDWWHPNEKSNCRWDNIYCITHHMTLSHSSPLCDSPAFHRPCCKLWVLAWDMCEAHTGHPLCPHDIHTADSRSANCHQAFDVMKHKWRVTNTNDTSGKWALCCCLYLFRLAIRSSATFNVKTVVLCPVIHKQTNK